MSNVIAMLTLIVIDYLTLYAFFTIGLGINIASWPVVILCLFVALINKILVAIITKTYK